MIIFLKKENKYKSSVYNNICEMSAKLNTLFKIYTTKRPRIMYLSSEW